MRTVGPYSILRWLMCTASLLITFWVCFSVFEAVQSTSDQVKTVDYDETVVAIFDAARQNVDQFFQMTVLVLGGLWTLAIVDKDQRIRPSDLPELLMLFIAIALLSACLFFLHRYATVMAQTVWDVRMLPGIHGQRLFPDLLKSPYLNLHSSVVVRCFYSGLVVSGLTALSLCRLRGNP